MPDLELIDHEPVVSGDFQLSTKFCSLDSDISYTSSDNIRFLVHKQNLEINATGFILLSEGSTNITLPESAIILETLFQFCYPERHPYLMSLDFDDFVVIAEAAEKYQVHAATNVCNVRMKRTLPSHAIEVMEYSARHNYLDLLAKTVSLLLDVPLSNILPRLPSHLVIPWVLQREQYAEVLSKAIAYYHTTTGLKKTDLCGNCGRGHDENLGRQIILDLQAGNGRLSALFNLGAIFDIKCSSGRPEQMHLALWRQKTQADLQDIPTSMF